MDLYKQPPAIVERAPSYVPDCLELVLGDQKNADATFPITVSEAKRFFPSGEGVERKLPPITTNRGISYIFLGYVGIKDWEIAIAFMTGTGQPIALYQIGSDAVKIEEQGVSVPIAYDTDFRFKRNRLDVRSRFSWQQLSELISSAHYTCRSKDRATLDNLFEQKTSGRAKNEVPIVPTKAPNYNFPRKRRIWNRKVPIKQ